MACLAINALFRRSAAKATIGTKVVVFCYKLATAKIRKVLDCGGRAQRRHRFRTHQANSYIKNSSSARKRRGGYCLPAAVHDAFRSTKLSGSL
jgi:hypothetical protein